MTALPIVIAPGDPGHIGHHQTIHALLNDVDSPFGIAPIEVDTLANLPTAAQAGRLYMTTTATRERLYVDDGADWLSPASIFTDVTDPKYGALGDDSTDDTAAIQAAHDAAPEGSTLFFPAVAAAYLFSTLSITKHLTLMGEGWDPPSPVAFGASYTGSYAGSVLRSTTTTGYALDVAPAATRFVWIEKLGLLGPGSGTSTGIRCGDANSMTGGIEKVWVANFARGLLAQRLISASIEHLFIRGCSTGFEVPVGGICNNLTAMNVQVEFSSVDGIILNAGLVLLFMGVLIQNASGTAGIRTASTTRRAAFVGCYFEAITATDALKFAAASCSIRDSYWASNGGRVTLGGTSDTFAFNTHTDGGAGIVESGTKNSLVFYTSSATPTINGTFTIDLPSDVGGKFGQRGSFINRAPITFTAGDTTPSVAAGNVFICSQSGATSITNFDDGITGQEIIVKLDGDTTLVHGSSTMRLAGGANIVGTTNDLVTLVLIGTIWYQKGISVN